MRRTFLLAFCLLVACGGPTRPDNAPTEGPPALPAVVYRWTFASTPEPALWIEIAMDGEEDGSTQFGLSKSWGPAADIQQSVQDVQVTAGGDVVATPELETVSIGHSELAVWTVKHEPGAPLTFRWRVTNDHEPRRKATRNFYGPIVRDDVVHVFGQFLVVPMAAEQMQRRVRVEFPDFEKLGWTVASSFHAGSASFEEEMPVDRLRAGIFYAGKSLRLNKVDIAGKPLYTAISGTYRASDADLTAMIGKIVTVQRDFFDEHDVPFFIVTVLPNDEHVNPETPESADTGTSLLNGFAAFLRPTSSLDSATAYSLKNLFAHEMLHQWVSGRIYMSPGPATASWFHEGFTTYMAAVLMRRADIFSPAEFLSHVNAFATAYQTSPMRSASNAEAAEAFWRGTDGHEIAYNRGAVLAAFLDRELRTVSEGKRGLDDFVRAMLASSSTQGPLDEARLRTMVESQTSAEFAKWYMERAVDGLGMDLPTDLFGDDFRGKAASDGVVKYVESK